MFDGEIRADGQAMLLVGSVRIRLSKYQSDTVAFRTPVFRRQRDVECGIVGDLKAKHVAVSLGDRCNRQIKPPFS